ncbi:hypothetical protein HCN44_008590 [Aphidius gifuensis]|uniref:Ionotropic glutamate receptor C-terminal domain-containing protein n=1 Tax=Aphidius gifuensis TaxID=684658 RepID=A0A834XPT7_APHGI|nr:hypothetical protein HCN44_008590 [Aphidius gifuensis]
MVTLQNILVFFLFTNVISFEQYSWYSNDADEPLQNIITYFVNGLFQYNQCIVFVLDHYYKNVIHYNWTNARMVPYYTILVRESENFDHPQKNIIKVLINSNNAGCDVYIILITNGFQVSQLLEYSERERQINTHGKFLLMYDAKLFDPEMKYIWNRITNVLFIRHYSISKQRSYKKRIRNWFDIETVTFPVKIKGGVITHFINTWYEGKIRYKNQLFEKKTVDLKKKKLRVAIFEHIPAVTKYSRLLYDDCSKKSQQALGIEFEIMRIIAKKINCKPVFYRPPDVEIKRWGTMSYNETFDGLIGEAVKGAGAFFLGDLHYTMRHHRLLELSSPYRTECLTFLTPESLTENSWKLLIIPFTLHTWIAILVIFCLCVSAFWIFSFFYKIYIIPYMPIEFNKRKMEDGSSLSPFTNIENSILLTYSMLFQVPLPKLPTFWAFRVFIGWWWLYTILVTVSYRASLTAALANPVGRMTIDTLSQLAKSAITVGGWDEDTRELFLASSDDDLQKIGEKFELTTNEEDSIARVAAGKFGYYENIYFLQVARAKRQVLESERKKQAIKQNQRLVVDNELHIMQECVISMPISIGMDRNSPLRPQVDNIIKNIIETGLVEKWLSDVMEWSKIAEIKSETDTPKATINIHKLSGAFFALVTGYFFGMILVIIENFYWKYIATKDLTKIK